MYVYVKGEMWYGKMGAAVGWRPKNVLLENCAGQVCMEITEHQCKDEKDKFTSYNIKISHLFS